MYIALQKEKERERERERERETTTALLKRELLALLSRTPFGFLAKPSENDAATDAVSTDTNGDRCRCRRSRRRLYGQRN